MIKRYLDVQANTNLNLSKKVSILNAAFNYGNKVLLDSYCYDNENMDAGLDRQRLIYQDIASIWFRLRLEHDYKNEFTTTEIGNYLLRHHSPFINEFAGSRMNYSSRLQSKRTYIEKRIADLLKLDILYRERSAKNTKNMKITPILH